MTFEQWFLYSFGWLKIAVLLLGVAFVIAAWSWHRAGAEADKLAARIKANEAAEFERVVNSPILKVRWANDAEIAASDEDYQK